MKGRKPREDELALWRQVTARATPLPGREPAPPPAPKFPAPPPAKTVIPPRDLPQPRAEPSLRMDRKAFQKLKRGKMTPEAKIDLHGMTLNRAHAALNRFIFSTQARGCRLVLVITGKGRPSSDDGPIPTRQGVLRHQVPHWLETPPLSALVLQIVQAHQSHGGGGAYYVYLRRLR